MLLEVNQIPLSEEFAFRLTFDLCTGFPLYKGTIFLALNTCAFFLYQKLNLNTNVNRLKNLFLGVVFFHFRR